MRLRTRRHDSWRQGRRPRASNRFNLKRADGTAKNAKNAKREELGKEAQFTVWVGLHLSPKSCVFAFFGFFAV